MCLICDSSRSALSAVTSFAFEASNNLKQTLVHRKWPGLMRTGSGGDGKAAAARGESGTRVRRRTAEPEPNKTEGRGVGALGLAMRRRFTNAPPTAPAVLPPHGGQPGHLCPRLFLPACVRPGESQLPGGRALLVWDRLSQPGAAGPLALGTIRLQNTPTHLTANASHHASSPRQSGPFDVCRTPSLALLTHKALVFRIF